MWLLCSSISSFFLLSSQKSLGNVVYPAKSSREIVGQQHFFERDMLKLLDNVFFNIICIVWQYIFQCENHIHFQDSIFVFHSIFLSCHEVYMLKL